MPRVALYARFSSDRQNERSIADQVSVCSRHAEARGWEVARIFSDAAISGHTRANRPGLNDAIEAAERGEYDILLTEDEDRIARSLEDLAHVVNRLTDVGAALATIATDTVETMHVAMKGFVSEEFLKNLSAKTKRGMRSNAEKGLATGSRTYGYRSSPGGAMEIVEEEAALIRRIFAEYAAGATARDIALKLNADGFPGPRGGSWGVSSIIGSVTRGNGVLNNDLYVGVKTWNRTTVKKDRRTGKRIPTTRPRSEWKTTPVPHLRIVDDGLWAAARARRDARSHDPVRYTRRSGIFSGLLKCGHCGGSYTIYTSDKLVCSNYRDRGTCTNRRTPSRTKLEARILEGLQESLLTPEAVSQYVRTYHEADRRKRANKAAERAPLTKRLGEVTRGIERVVDAIVSGAANDAMKARMASLDAERLEIEAKLAEVDQEPEPAYDFHPQAPEAYAALVSRLIDTLRGVVAGETPAERELIDAVRGLVDRIEIQPVTQERHGPIDISLAGSLVNFLTENPRLGKLVAGASYNRTQPIVPFSGRLRL